jgi:hypothetical protein
MLTTATEFARAPSHLARFGNASFGRRFGEARRVVFGWWDFESSIRSPAAGQTGLGDPDVMSTNVKIEVDERTADVLQARAAELGVTVSELLVELATLDSDPVVVEPDEIVELDRRWKKIEAGTPTVPNERVVRWLRTWGTPGFRPWRAR